MGDASMEEGRRVRRAVALLVAVPLVLVSGMLTVMFVYALAVGVRGPLGGGPAAKAFCALVAFTLCAVGVRLIRFGVGFGSARHAPADGAESLAAARIGKATARPDVMPMTRSRDNFFLWTAVAIATTVFAGFWFTYFGPMIAGDRPPDAPAVHLHGWTFFAWYVLLVVQSALVRSRRISLHRGLGGSSVALAALMAGTGLLVVAFYGAALRMRHRPDWHKRLMIIASVGGMGASTFRLCMVLFGPDSAMWLGLLGSNLFIVAGIVRDSLVDKRVHPAWWIGLYTCVAVEAGMMLLTPTPPGQAVSHALAAIGRTFTFLY